MKACVSEPVSFLRLERYHLGELGGGEQHAIADHLAQCDACRQCLHEIEAPLELPALPARAAVLRPARARWWQPPRAGWLALATAACALAALLMLPVTPGFDPPGASRHIKGGELAIGLVREHAGAIDVEPLVFSPGDRFKVLLTCPPSLQLQVDVVVFQEGEASFPLAAQRVNVCGNQRPLAGAFSLSGEHEAQVCIAAVEAGAVPPIDRAALRSGGLRALPELSVCQRVRAASW